MMLVAAVVVNFLASESLSPVALTTLPSNKVTCSGSNAGTAATATLLLTPGILALMGRVGSLQPVASAVAYHPF
jgi:hypothetical protein